MPEDHGAEPRQKYPNSARPATSESDINLVPSSFLHNGPSTSVPGSSSMSQAPLAGGTANDILSIEKGRLERAIAHVREKQDELKRETLKKLELLESYKGIDPLERLKVMNMKTEQDTLFERQITTYTECLNQIEFQLISAKIAQANLAAALDDTKHRIDSVSNSLDSSPKKLNARLLSEIPKTEHLTPSPKELRMLLPPTLVVEGSKVFASNPLTEQFSEQFSSSRALAQNPISETAPALLSPPFSGPMRAKSTKKKKKKKVKRRFRRADWVIPTPVVEPDSQQVRKLLPEKTECHLKDQKLHFVNREQAMLSLLEVHLEHYMRTHQGGPIVYPLMDSLFGMGKSTFCLKYLAMLERYVSNKMNECHGDKRSVALAILLLIDRPVKHTNSESPSLSDTPAELCDARQPSEAVVNSLLSVLDDLRQARTLYIELEPGSLACKSHDTWMNNFMGSVRKALYSQWGVRVPRDEGWAQCRDDYILKPCFIVFDEVGAAFERVGVDEEQQRLYFLNFVQIICKPISKRGGVYYLLSGRASFLWDVGVRPEDVKLQLKVSAGCFSRIHLNPIREEYIGEILRNTTLDGRTLEQIVMDNCNGLSLDDFKKQLFLKSSGHPRSLASRLLSTEPLGDSCTDDPLILDDVERLFALPRSGQ